jgi:hypothetical protein
VAVRLIDCSRGCTTLLDASTPAATRQCFENYLASPARDPLSTLGSPTAIGAREGSLVLTYGVGSRRSGLEVVVPCPALKAVIATPRGTFFRYSDRAVSVDKNGGILTFTASKRETEVSASVSFDG